MAGSSALARTDKHFSPVVEGDRMLPGEGGLADPLTAEDPTANTSREYEDSIITLSREAYYSSKTWWDSSIRQQIERNLRAFNNEHPAGSKYHTEQYRKKSKLFRPKTRTAIRKASAAVAKAFFSSSDVLHCSPVNDADKKQVLAAEVHMALVNFRLDQKQVHWYQTVVGAATDADSTGVCISKQDWRFVTQKVRYDETYIDQYGGEHRQQVEEEEPLEDRPQVTNVPIENLRFDPACDWRDPINTSPYIIELVPMYIDSVMEMSQRINPMTGKTYYQPVPQGMLAASVHQDWDSVRKAREGDRIDKYDNDTMLRPHQSVWVHKHIMRIGGKDYCWDTIGSEIMLSWEIEPIEHRYLTGNRPYVMGYTNIEPHKLYPAGKPELIDGLQEEANDIVNLRLDNVKLALNKRYFAKRGAGIDIRSLVRNVAGSVTMMGNPNTDVKIQETRDVTGSSYEEQDRINVDIDDLLGDFNAGSVQTNRKLGETVGGMEMMGASASTITEFDIRTFAETWYEPVLRQLVELEAAYETDRGVLHVVGSRVGIEDIQEVLDVITQPIRVKVNVGFDATNPERRIQRLAFGMNAIREFAPKLAEKVDGAELVKEVFGAIGYADGTRFWPHLSESDDPRIAELESTVEQLVQIIESKQAEKQAEMQGKMEIENMKQQGQLARDQMKYEAELIMQANSDNLEAAIAQMKDRMEQLSKMIEMEDSRRKRDEFYLQREALSHEIQEANRRFELEKQGKTLEEGGAMNLPGEDKAGVITRDRFGMIPSMAEGGQ